jgi:hypothetical protein
MKKKLLLVAAVTLFGLGILAFVASSTEAGGPKVCPLIGCGPCATLQKVPGQKCPVCVAIPGCTP